MELYAVRQRRGGPWDWTRGLRQQEGFAEHGRFVDDLVDDGFIVLGGPLEGDHEVLLIIDAPDDQAIRSRLADDPWIKNGMLTLDRIERWTILLGAGVRRLAGAYPRTTGSATRPCTRVLFFQRSSPGGTASRRPG